MELEKKKAILSESGFKCQKCGFYSLLGEGLEVNNDLDRKSVV